MGLREFVRFHRKAEPSGNGTVTDGKRDVYGGPVKAGQPRRRNIYPYIIAGAALLTLTAALVGIALVDESYE